MSVYELRSFVRTTAADEGWAAVAQQEERLLAAGWSIERLVAESERARVFRVHRSNDKERRPFAAKVLRVTDDGDAASAAEFANERVLREVVALRALSESGCPNIPHVVTFGLHSDRDAEPWYVMPYYASESMWTDAGHRGFWAESYRGNVDRVLEIAESLATTLAFMHGCHRPCVHGNVTVGNVLLNAPGSTPILGGFGRASIGRWQAAHDARSAPMELWRPPELSADSRRPLTPAVDIFMLGGLVYESLTGGRQLPPPEDWGDSCVHERPEYSVRRDTTDPRAEAISLLLRGMLVRSAKRRLSAHDVARACRAIRTGRTVPGRTMKALLAAGMR